MENSRRSYRLQVVFVEHRCGGETRHTSDSAPVRIITITYDLPFLFVHLFVPLRAFLDRLSYDMIPYYVIDSTGALATNRKAEMQTRRSRRAPQNRGPETTVCR